MSFSTENVRDCEICGRTYNHDRLDKCPRCKGDTDYLKPKPKNTPETAISFVRPCENCGREYNHVQLSECPSCADTGESAVAKKTDPTIAALHSLKDAQDKTRHATRASDLTWTELSPDGATVKGEAKPSTAIPESDLTTLLNENVEATNRTTHAVRAFVSYFAAFMITGLVGMMIWTIGTFALTKSDDPVLTMTVTSILILLVAFAGTTVALVWFFKEWTLSKVPKR